MSKNLSVMLKNFSPASGTSIMVDKTGNLEVMYVTRANTASATPRAHLNTNTLCVAVKAGSLVDLLIQPFESVVGC